MSSTDSSGRAITRGELAGLERRLTRLEEQEIAVAVERGRRIHERHGLPFDAEAQAAVEAFTRHKRSWPAGLDISERLATTGGSDGHLP